LLGEVGVNDAAYAQLLAAGVACEGGSEPAPASGEQ